MVRIRRRKRYRLFLFLLFIVFVYLLLNSPWFLRFYYPLPYKELIFRFAAQNELDPFLVAAVIRVESRFYPHAESARGARGLMQLMPETGSWVARQMQLRFEPDLLFTPEYNIRLGCWYLANLHQEFNGDTTIVLAAYNGGRGRVKEWLQTGQWSGDLKSVGDIPFPETRDFVREVYRGYRIYRNIYL